MRYFSVAATAVLLTTAVFSSCTCHDQVAPPPAPEPVAMNKRPSGFRTLQGTPQVNAQGPTVTPAAQAPEVAEAAVTPTVVPHELPADFPKDVPIYKDSTLSQVQDMANDGHNLIFSTKDPVPEVAAFYELQLSRAGWRVTQQMSRGNHAFYTFQKGDLIANLTVAEDSRHPGQQIISIMYERQKPLDFEEF